MLDCHTREGRGIVTLLSGHYDKHLELSGLVEAHGWNWIRANVHEAPKAKPTQFEVQMRRFR
jgi:hypothetical protein